MVSLRDFILALGGALVGGGGVATYAKASGQEINWRRKLLFRVVARAFAKA